MGDPQTMKSISQANRTYIVLVVSYIVSQFYRVSNAVTAPEMMRSLRLTPEEMGAITGIFFLAFGLMQLPTGVLLDRIDSCPRKELLIEQLLDCPGTLRRQRHIRHIHFIEGFLAGTSIAPGKECRYQGTQ
jgi:MFS family permease